MRIPEAARRKGLEAIRRHYEAELGVRLTIVHKDELATLRDGQPAPVNDHPVNRPESKAV